MLKKGKVVFWVREVVGDEGIILLQDGTTSHRGRNGSRMVQGQFQGILAKEV